MELHSPKNTILRIDRMFAFVSVDPEDGCEGVCAAPVMGPQYGLIPLVGADMARIESIRPWARWCAVNFKMEVKLVEFTARVEREVIATDGTVSRLP